MRFGTAAALAASVVGAVADDKYLGFNSGATDDKGVLKMQKDFEAEFTAAQKLKGAPGTFSAVRLYTNIQGETEDSPIEAFPAAIKTKTKILLGMWASGTTNIDKELSALDNAITKYGDAFTDLVIGISVGSEDLYRISGDGIANEAGVGAQPSLIVDFIKDTRAKIKGTALEKTPVGHVDTWTTWANSSNSAVVDACDFLGVNSFPYYENGDNIKTTNSIDNAGAIFQASLKATTDAVGDKPIWITETGWPLTGPDQKAAKPSVANAEQYWQDVGCALFGKTNTFWYILRDSNPDNKMKFGINPQLDAAPEFNLTCPEKKATPSASASASPSKSASPSATAVGSDNDSSEGPRDSANPSGSGSANANANAPESAASSASPTPAGSSSASALAFSSGVLCLAALVAAASYTV